MGGGGGTGKSHSVVQRIAFWGQKFKTSQLSDFKTKGREPGRMGVESGGIGVELSGVLLRGCYLMDTRVKLTYVLLSSQPESSSILYFVSCPKILLFLLETLRIDFQAQ